MTADTRESKFTMALRGGVALDRRLLVGVELGGWTIQGSNVWDPAQGEAISTRFLIAQAYPLTRSPFFIRGGGGRVEYWNNRPGENGASGSAWIVGVGYDLPVRMPGSEEASFHVTPSLDYSSGGFKGATSPPGVVQDERYRALSARIGVTFR